MTNAKECGSKILNYCTAELVRKFKFVGHVSSAKKLYVVTVQTLKQAKLHLN
jgi:hypothetical protein